MPLVLTAAAVIAGVVVLTPLSDRLRVPQPVLLTIFGLMIPLVPGVPPLEFTPELILPVVLPPLLFAATQRTTLGEVRESARPILGLAIGLTCATAAIVAVVAHAAGLGWTAAWVLGAIVSPPDPVAATAVARRLRLPSRLVTVLEGEGMFNDATALVLYKVAVATAVTGAVTVGEVALGFVLAIVVGVAVGILLGWVTQQALAALHDGPPETMVTFAMPFGAYLIAEELYGSGVLAVLALGLYLRTYSHTSLTSSGYLLGRSVWEFADFTISSVVFVLIGFELTELVGHSETSSDTYVLAAAVIATVILFRAVWMLPGTWLARRRAHRSDAAAPPGWSETAVASWAGMRGVVTVATALALPHAVEDGGGFPDRAQVVLVALLCVLVTLIVQGLTLAPLVALLGVGTEADEHAEIVSLRRQAAAAALAAVDTRLGDLDPAVREAVRIRYEGYLASQDALAQARASEGQDLAEGELRRGLQMAADIEREVVIDSRQQGHVSPAAADAVRDEVESRAIRDHG